MATKIEEFVPKSSFIMKVEYDADARSMTLTFKTGTQAKYLYVFPSTWLSFKQSPDHSSYYSKAIKGRLMSVSIQSHKVGKNLSTPLYHKTEKRSLDNGRTKGFEAGTVRRAFKG